MDEIFRKGQRALINTARQSVEILDDQEFLSFFEQRFFPKRSYLLEPGNISQYEYYVVSGCLRVFVTDQSGDEHTLYFTPEGHWVGDLESFLNRTPAVYSIEALEDTHVFMLNHKSWNKLLSQLPDVNKYFRIGFQKHLISLQSRIIQNISNTAEERYEKFMALHGKLSNRVPQKHIASYLGVTPEFLSLLRRKRSQKTLS